MSSLNKVMLIGNLGRDAELKYTAGGVAVASVSLATTETWGEKDSQGNYTGKRNEKTEWHRVSIWGKQAETLAAYLVKGKQIYVEGRIQYREYEKDGSKRWATDIRADRVQLLGKKEGGSDSAPHPADAPVTDDDIPF